MMSMGKRSQLVSYGLLMFSLYFQHYDARIIMASFRFNHGAKIFCEVRMILLLSPHDGKTCPKFGLCDKTMYKPAYLATGVIYSPGG